MGPSILAGAFTTVAGAVVMLFTVILFFQKFALILFYTVIMATTCAFVVFLSISDTCGPKEPTIFVDAILGKLCGSGRTSQESESKGATSKQRKMEYKEDAGSIAAQSGVETAADSARTSVAIERLEI
jgi:hypothetical protein